MRSSFQGYYKLNDDDYRRLWENAIFVLDANVLLNLYRYTSETRDDLLKILRRLGDRLWLPYQVALEYQENRPYVISEQVRRYDEVEGLLEEVQDQLKNGLDNLQLRKRHSSIDPDALLQSIESVFSDFRLKMGGLRANQLNVSDTDKIRIDIDSLFEGRVGPRPDDQEQLNSLYEEARKRFEDKRPPGYKDINKSKHGERSTYLYGGLVFERAYGDYVLWHQIISQANFGEWKYVIFVTDDVKEDWWWIVKGKSLGPRPELVEEIRSKAGVEIFHLYTPQRFMQYAGEVLDIGVNKKSIQQVEDIARIVKRERAVVSRVSEYRRLAEIAEVSFKKWLEKKNPSGHITHDHRSFPDFTVSNEDSGRKVGFVMKVASSPISFIRLLREASYRAYYEVQEKGYDHIVIVLVAQDKETLVELSTRAHRLISNLPPNVGIMMGLVTPDDDNQDVLVFTEMSANVQPRLDI